MDLGISGRRAAVAAASKGLGYASAAALAEAGVQVAICGRDRDDIEAAAARIGPNAIADRGRRRDGGGGDRLRRRREGRARRDRHPRGQRGWATPGRLRRHRRHRRVRPRLRAQRLSTIAMCQAAVPAMQAQQWGRVVAITSIAARQPIAHLILSNTARAGLTGFLKTLAREIAKDGVTVNSLQPGLHATERITGLYGDVSGLGAGVPAGKVGDPADFGRVVAFLCSESANYVTGHCDPRRRRRRRRSPVIRHVSSLTFRGVTPSRSRRHRGLRRSRTSPSSATTGRPDLGSTGNASSS